MKNSLLIGNYIFDVISNMNVPTFPIVAEQGTTFPFCVYRRVGLNAQDTKDGIVDDTVTYEINVYSKGYKEGLTLINNIRKALGKRYSKEGLSITDMTIVGSQEDYAQEAYWQQITYMVTVS